MEATTVPVNYTKKLKSKHITASSHYGRAPTVEGRTLTCKIASNMLLIITYSRMVFWLMLSVTWVQTQVLKSHLKPPPMLQLPLAHIGNRRVLLPDGHIYPKSHT